MTRVQWILAAVVGVALLYYVRRRAAVATVPVGPVVSTGPGINNPGAGINAPTSGPTGTGAVGRGSGTGINPGTTMGGPVDVAPADLETTGERDVFLDDINTGSDAQLVSWRDRFNRQVGRPAQLLLTSDLVQQDFDRAWALLNGTLALPSKENMSDRQKRAKDLSDSDGTANTLWGVFKDIADAAGTITFGLTTLAVNLVDQDAGDNGESVTDSLNKTDKLNQAIQGSLTGTDLLVLAKWLGPVEIIGGRNPSTGWADGAPWVPAPSFDQSVTPAGVAPIFTRAPLFASGESGWYLRWTSDDLTGGRTFRERVNIRARMYRALDVIACQLFPFPTVYDPTVGDEPGFYTFYNAAYKGPQGLASGWLKGSVFRPGKGDITYQALAALRAAQNAQLNAPVTLVSQGNAQLNQPTTAASQGNVALIPAAPPPGIVPTSGTTTIPIPAPIASPRPAPRPPVVVITGPKGHQVQP
jgi:hypothetical protein